MPMYDVNIYYIQIPNHDDETEDNAERRDHFLQYVLSFGNKGHRKAEKRFYDLVQDNIEINDHGIDTLLDFVFAHCQDPSEGSNMFTRKRPMMFGDIIEVDGQKYVVEHFGFSEIEWEEE